MARSAQSGRTAKAKNRSMNSEVYWLLLGLVIEKPGYGHELYQRYERVYGELARISGSSHIYAGLDVLERRMLVERFSLGAEGGRQPKPHYRATRAGVHSYEQWLVKRIDFERQRHELLARQLGVFARSPAVGLRVLERLEQRCLEGSGQVGTPSGRRLGLRDELVDDLVNERLRIAVGGTLSWLRHAIERFEALVRNGPPGA